MVALSSAEAELGAAVLASQEVLAMMSLWKDVGENIRGNACDGRPPVQRHSGIVRRMGFRKGETLEHELVVRSREERASHELQYD